MRRISLHSRNTESRIHLLRLKNPSATWDRVEARRSLSTDPQGALSQLLLFFSQCFYALTAQTLQIRSALPRDSVLRSYHSSLHAEPTCRKLRTLIRASTSPLRRPPNFRANCYTCVLNEAICIVWKRSTYPICWCYWWVLNRLMIVETTASSQRLNALSPYPLPSRSSPQHACASSAYRKCNTKFYISLY